VTMKVDMRTSVKPKYKVDDTDIVDRGIPDEGQYCHRSMDSIRSEEEPAVCTRKKCQMWHRNGNFCIEVAALNSHSFNMKCLGAMAEVEVRKYMAAKKAFRMAARQKRVNELQP
jgi:hypothetical protein